MKELGDLQQLHKDTVKAIDSIQAENSFAGGFYNAYNSGKREFYQKQQTESKMFDDSWIKTIESYFPSINRITVNLKSNIKYQSEILPVEKAKKTGREAVIHLTAHTHYIQEITEDGVLPKKVLTSLSETEYGIYENRFIMTLIIRLRDYLARRIKLIKQQLKATRITHLNVSSKFAHDNAEYEMLLEIKRTSEFNVRTVEEHNQNVLERAEKMYKLISRLYMGQFMQIMKRFKKVSAPIMKTQVILKNPDFKNAYYLWLYLDKTAELGFSLNTETVNKRFTPVYIKQLNQLHLLAFSTLVANSQIAAEQTKALYKSKKAQIVNKLAGEVEVDPTAYSIENTAVNEFYLNRSRQILKKQMDEYLEADPDYKAALKQTLEDTVQITNSLYQSYFAINADQDVFSRLIQEDDPEKSMQEAYDKLNIAQIVREVKERDYLDAIKLEEKWQAETAAKQKNYLAFAKKTAAAKTEKELAQNKQKFDSEIKLINRKASQEKAQLLRRNKLELAAHERILKQQLRQEIALLKKRNREKLAAEKAKQAKKAAEQKIKQAQKHKQEKEQLKKAITTGKMALNKDYAKKKTEYKTNKGN